MFGYITEFYILIIHTKQLNPLHAALSQHTICDRRVHSLSINCCTSGNRMGMDTYFCSGCGDGTAVWREWVGMAVEMGWSVWDGNSLWRGVDLLSVPV